MTIYYVIRERVTGVGLPDLLQYYKGGGGGGGLGTPNLCYAIYGHWTAPNTQLK